TDSGYIFARWARQELGISEDRILAPADALARLRNDGPRPLVFVDDFAGSGDQFVETWTCCHELGLGVTDSLRDCCRRLKNIVFYCTAICGDLGRRVIARDHPEVVLCAAAMLDERYSALSDTSHIWPDHLKPSAVEFIRQASTRANITKNWRGYRNQ